MINRLHDSSKEKVLSLIEKEKLENFYLYMDLQECGCDQDGLGLWEKIKDNKSLILYRYYDCFHLFGNSKCIDSEVYGFISDFYPKVISGSNDIIDSLIKNISNRAYKKEINHIITIDKNLDLDDSALRNISVASEEDIPAIAQLMLKDRIYKHVYTFDKLSEDLYRRLSEGFGRMFILRENGRIVAANSTNAETKEFAVIGGLITDPDYRGKGYGGQITAYTWNLIREEGKRGLAYLLFDNEKTILLHKKLGYSFIGNNARIVFD